MNTTELEARIKELEEQVKARDLTIAHLLTKVRTEPVKPRNVDEWADSRTNSWEAEDYERP